MSPVGDTTAANTSLADMPNDALVDLGKDDELIAMLATLKPMDYDRVRQEHAKALGVQVKTLDATVKKARSEESDSVYLPFPEVESHLDPIDPALLLNEISITIMRFIVLNKEQADAAALWVAFTWFINVVEIAPLAIINAPEKACGKSQLLDLLGRMSARPLSAANSTSAFLFRAVEKWTPTILIDEADTFIRQNDELKGLINAGYTRANAFVGRVVGENNEPKLFKVWGAKALAGIALEKHLPDATMSRAIVLELRRKLPSEKVSRLRDAEHGLFDGIASKLSRFSDDYSKQVRLARPTLPDELNDRAQDNWQPLMAIAECVGPEWVKRATAAALILSSAGDKSISTGNELLADIQHIFDKKNVEKISTVDLIEALCVDTECGWAAYNRGKPLNPRQLARLLATYGIQSKTVRMGKNNTPKGFDADQFKDAFARYLASDPSASHTRPAPEKLPQCRNDATKTMNGMASDVADKTQLSPHDAPQGEVSPAHPVADVAQQTPICNIPATLKPLPYVDCGGVADKVPLFGGTDSTRPDAPLEDAF